MKPYRGPPMTQATLRDPGEMAERYGAETTVLDWHARLTCSGCGSRQVEFVVTGTERRPKIAESQRPIVLIESAASGR
jgi:hypothetical protein